MDEWGWEHLRPWIDHRPEMPIGALFCVINGPTCGRPWSGPGGADTAAAPRRSRPACDGASLLTSYATPMPSRWLGRACR